MGKKRNEAGAWVKTKFVLLELLSDLMKEKPVEETGYQNIIIVDNTPKGPDRMVKLQGILNKIFTRFGRIVSQDYPIDDQGNFKG